MDYSNNRYNRRFPNIITPPKEIPKIQPITQIAPIKEIPKIQGYTSLTARQRTYQRLKQDKQTQTFLANYNDPTELNSYIDALTNREAVSKKFGETWGALSTVSGTVAVLSFAGSIVAAALAPFTGGASLAAAAPLAKIGAVAAVPAIPAAADVTIEKGIKPIVAGKPKEAALNLLMNFGETMDYAANPVKGLILEGGEGFAKATGLSSAGRVNYDYNTGFFLTDMLLEILSDPVNLAQTVASAGSNKAITEVVEQSVENINKNFFDTIGAISAEGAERINKQLTKTTKQIAKEWNEAAFKNLTPEARDLLYASGRDRLQRAWVIAIQKELPEATPSQIQRMLKTANVNAVTNKFSTSVLTQINNLTLDDLSSNIIKYLEGVQHYSSAFDKFMTKGALFTSGYGLGIEAIRKNKGIREWANNFTIANAKRIGALDSRGELNLKEWLKTKAVWSEGQKYTTMLSGEVTPRTVDTLYALATEHFNRNQVAIRNICLSNADPITKSAQLDALFTNLYGCNYAEYVDLLKQIDKLENGKFTEFYKYADSQSKLLSKEAFLKPIAGKPITDTQLFHSNSLESYKKEQFKALDELNKVVKLTPDAIKTEDKFFTIKLNDARQNSYLIHNKEIAAVMDKLSESAEVGAMWNKIKEDIRTLSGDVSAEISAAVRDVLNAPVHFNSLRDLYNALSQIYVPEVISEAFKEKDLAYYIFDQIHGLQNKTVTELLAGFDSVTMPDLMHSLDMFVSDMGVTLSDSVELTTQISISLRNYLEALQNADIDYIAGAVGNEFTQGVETLSKHFSAEFGDELFEFTQANEIIKIQMAAIRDQNIEFLEHIVSTKGTIFDAMGIRNTRELSDLGLALKTVATKENLDLFDFDMADVPGTVFKSAERIGASINRLKKGFEQYNVVFNFNKERKAAFENLYNRFYYHYCTKDIGHPAMAYLAYAPDEDIVTRFAQMAVFCKLAKDTVHLKNFKDVLIESLDTNTYLDMLNPERLMVTDFAFDAMKQSRWIAEKQIAEEAINVIKRYQNLSTIPRQITQNFINMQNFLSQNKFDRPKMLQYARYVDAVKPVNNMLQFLEQHYNSRFNKTLAEERINQLRHITLMLPSLSEYDDLIDTLEAYWRGEKTFAQSAKADAQLYTRTRYDLQSKVKAKMITPETMQAELQALKDNGIVDEFTEFWEQIKEMNEDIRIAVTEFNERVAEGLEEVTQQLKYTSVTPWDPIREQQQLNKLIEKATTLNGQGALKRLFKMNSDQFTKELAFRKRFVVMHDSDITDKHLFNHFKNGLDSKAVVYHYDDTTKLHWFALHKDQKTGVKGRQIYLNTEALIRQQPISNFDEFQIVDKYIADPNNPGITKTLNELDNSLYELTGTHLGDSQGELFSQDMFTQLYKQMPEDIQEAVADLNTKAGKAYFDAYAFNESVLGSSVGKRSLGMYSSNMITNASNAITQAMNYVKPRTEYVHTVFDSALSIDSPNSIWKNFTDEQLLAALQSTREYRLMALVEDKKWGVKVREILPTSVEMIKKAKELGATIVPVQVAHDMINSVNHRLGSAGLAKLWSRIMYVYKSVFLMRPGAMIRNFIDTNSKTMLETKGEYATYMSQASKILNDVDRLKTYIKEATRLDLPNEKRLTRSKAIQQWFAEGNAKYLNYEQYLELDADFLSQGISGNITRMLDKGNVEGDLWKTYTDITGWIVEAGNKTEDYNRLAMYLYELDKGTTKTGALAKLAKTHFDYSFKSEIEQLIEFVFPFTTFALRNLSYWTETIMKQPWIARNYVHLMKPHWDFQDYTPEELARNYQVQNQIINGQLKLGEFNNKIITFKANPSIQNALTMFADPVNAILGNLAVPIATPLNLARGEYTQPLNAIPLIGPMIQTAQTMIKNKNPLPSVIGTMQKPKRTGAVKFKNKNLTNVNKFTDNTYRTPKYRNNIVFDSYATKGITRYRVNLYPVIDIAQDVRSRYSVNVYNKIKNRVKTDVFNGIRYRIRLDANRFR